MIPQLLFDMMFDVPVVHVHHVSRVQETVEISHICRSSYSCVDNVVDMPGGAQRQMLWFQSAENCERPTVTVHFDMVVDVPVMQVCSRSSSTRSSPSLSSTSSMAVMAVERVFRREMRHLSRSVSAH